MHFWVPSFGGVLMNVQSALPKTFSTNNKVTNVNIRALRVWLIL